MPDLEITLTIPQHLYDRVRRLADENGLPIEQVILNQLESALIELPALPPDEQSEVDALEHLSDDALWTIAREQMPEDHQSRMQLLMESNNLGTISDVAQKELSGLVEQGQRLMLRKAKAMSLLAERGYSIHPKNPARG